MSRFFQATILGFCAVLLAVGSTFGQYPSDTVGFNGPPIDNPATSQEMFRIPEWSGTTRSYVMINSTGVYNQNAAFRASGWQTEGDAALDVSFNWVSAGDPDAWVRLTTFNGPERPNPALDTSGKVRFKITNRGDLFFGDLGLCLGIRETGTDVPQLADGGSSGPIEWVGVNTALSVVDCGTNGCQTPRLDDDVLTTNGPQEFISWGPDRQLDSLPVQGDDAAHYGYVVGTNGIRTPVPALTLPIWPAARLLQWNLATGAVEECQTEGPAPDHVWSNCTSLGGGITGFTGDGLLNAPNNRGTLEHVALTKVAADAGISMAASIDELRFEATVPDPVPPPTVVYPIVAGDTIVTVTDLVHDVDQVVLYVNAASPQTLDVVDNSDVNFTIAPAVSGDVYTATQRSSQSGVVSPLSGPVTVLPEPPLYSFSTIIDQGGTGSCNFTTGWEWVGVTSVTGSTKWLPLGTTPLFSADAVWQTIDVPLDDDDLILACLGGNGILEPSPTGFYTLDSIWFTMAEAGTNGPWEVLIDTVQYLNVDGQPSVPLLSMEDGVNALPTVRGQSQYSLTATELIDQGSYDGTFSHRLEWSYGDTDPLAIGILERTGGCGTSVAIPDTATALRLHMVCRGQPTNPAVDLPVIVGPIVGNQSSVRVLNDPAATAVQLYINGQPVGAPVAPSGPQTDFAGLTLAAGDSVSATQTVGLRGVSDLGYPRATATAPLPPAVQTPIYAGADSVTVTALAAAYATASTVSVYVNGQLAGTAAGGTAAVVVTVPELEVGDAVTATQTVNGAVSAQSAAVTAQDTLIYEYEFALRLIDLTRAISNADLINGVWGTLESGDVDPLNGVSAWNMNSTSACLEMLNNQASPGFHAATPSGNGGGRADLTDGVPGTTVEAVLADFNRASLVMRYDFSAPTNLEEIVVFAANEDPNAPRNGRIFQNYDVWVSRDNGQSYAPLITSVRTGNYGLINTDDNRATFTVVRDVVSEFVALGATNVRFVFYCVSNTAGRFQDPWQGKFNEDAGYATLCPTTEPQDLDGYRKAFEAPIIKEVDVFGHRRGDFNADGAVDVADYAAFAECLSGPGLAPNPAAPPTAGQCLEQFDYDDDGDVDLDDFAVFQDVFTG